MVGTAWQRGAIDMELHQFTTDGMDTGHKVRDTISPPILQPPLITIT